MSFWTQQGSVLCLDTRATGARMQLRRILLDCGKHFSTASTVGLSREEEQVDRDIRRSWKGQMPISILSE